MKNTFFDNLMLADSERVHTQTLAWIFALDDSVFSVEQKKKFFGSLFEIEDLRISQKVFVETELNKIDLFLAVDNYQFVIENKLKSSEHDNQTSKYKETIPRKFADSNRITKFEFLTLIKDEPQDQDWNPISFEKLTDLLAGISWNDNKDEVVIIKEYIHTLRNLTDVYKKFITNHKDFKNVFTDGNKKKYEKNQYKDEFQDYIRKNQLETIFQKAFLKDILKSSKIQYNGIGETRGTALFQTYICDVKAGETTFRLGFQFQGKTLKINLAHEKYSESKPEQIEEYLINIFINNFYQVDGYGKLNKPRNKAYISVSRPLKERMVYEMDKSELISLFQNEIDKLKYKSQGFINDVDLANNSRL